MMTDLQARIAICIACLLIAVAGIFGWFWFISHIEQRGYNRAVDEYKVAEAAAKDKARRAEDDLRTELHQAATARHEDKLRHEKDLATLRAAARAGTERLRCPALPASGTPDHPPAAGGLGNEARSGDIVPGTADDLFRIAASIAAGVLRENALIDTYNAARATCNKDQ